LHSLTAIFIAIGIFRRATGRRPSRVGIDSAVSGRRRLPLAVEIGDITEGMVKGTVFGIACSLIAVYEGFNSVPTAEGVGRATTRTVVISSVVTLVLNFV